MYFWCGKTITNTPCISSQLYNLPFFPSSLLARDWFLKLEKQVNVLSSETLNSFSAAIIWREFLPSQPAATEANSFVSNVATLQATVKYQLLKSWS